jgi:hypothetical protein
VDGEPQSFAGEVSRGFALHAVEIVTHALFIRELAGFWYGQIGLREESDWVLPASISS